MKTMQSSFGPTFWQMFNLVLLCEIMSSFFEEFDRISLFFFGCQIFAKMK
jgi:hypothetical protein